MKNVINLVLNQFTTVYALRKRILIIILLSIVIPLINSIDQIPFSISIILMGMTYNIVSFESSCGIDELIATLPVTRKQYIMSRYLYGTLCLISTNIMALVIYDILRLIGKLNKPIPIIAIFTTTGLVGLILISITIPLILIFGTEKAKIAILILVVIPVTWSPVLCNMILKLNLPTLNPIFCAILAVLIGILIIYISYLITLNLYNKKEIY